MRKLRRLQVVNPFAALLLLGFCNSTTSHAQSIAEIWNDATLFAISRDFARPTVHARNLYHTSIAMHDAWAAYDPAAEQYLLGRTRGTYTSNFNGVAIPSSPEAVEAARAEALSFATYRLLRHRFQNSPNAFVTFQHLNQKMDQLGYNRFNLSTDYVNGGPAEFGNYIAQQLINFGLTDGSNESGGYSNLYYQPVNPNILPEQPGTTGVVDPNRWQAISLSVQIDQSGNAVSNPPFLSPEWGNVLPFALTDNEKSVYERDGHFWNVYYDPGDPCYIDTTDSSGLESLYKWNFCLVSVWQSHNDPANDVMIDISPAAIGNIDPANLPTNYEDYTTFYDFVEGGVQSPGHSVNPITGLPYEPNFVKRGDYARVLAEYWADGPNSVTPPGHWFDIYNIIRKDPLFINQWNGQGPILSDLEMDVKVYLTLGGAMHDVAITAWGIKGYYDYLRPVTGIRYMCEKGQCSDPDLPNYHPAGMPLLPGFIELVNIGDPLAGTNNENVGKIKLYTWKGPEYIPNPENTFAGVDWILGEKWWPYQRPSFVTPPFAGFISGHSTYSRTAAEVMTLITGTPYFPGGMKTFVAEQNEYLEFEDGPSDTVVLQWATYQDASDQCSLSRIWGGIHPPVDDIPGRLIGLELGPQVFDYATSIFDADRPVVVSVVSDNQVVNIDDIGTEFSATITYDRAMNTAVAPAVAFLVNNPLGPAVSVANVGWISPTQYKIDYLVGNSNLEMPDVYMRINSASAVNGTTQNVHLVARPFTVDTRRPLVTEVASSTAIANDATAAGSGMQITISFDEACDTEVFPTLTLQSSSDLSGTLIFNPAGSFWQDNMTFVAAFTLLDNNEEIENIGVLVSAAIDAAGNAMLPFEAEELFDIDTRNPILNTTIVSNELLNTSSVGSQALAITLEFDEPMNVNITPALVFNNDNPVGTVLAINAFATGWVNATTHTTVYNQVNSSVELDNITVSLSGFNDLAANPPSVTNLGTLFSVDTRKPEVTDLNPPTAVLSDADVADGSFHVDIAFQEAMSPSQLLLVQINGVPGVSGSLSYNPFGSSWLSDDTFRASFIASDQNVEIEGIGINVSFGLDMAGNTQVPYSQTNWMRIDTKNPAVQILLANTYTVTGGNIGQGGFFITTIFDEAMKQDNTPEVVFSAASNVGTVLTANTFLSGWLNGFTYQAYFDVAEADAFIPNIEVAIENATDLAGNLIQASNYPAFFSININTSSTGDELANFGLQVYPNPVRTGEPLTLELARSLENVSYQLWSAEGKLVTEKFMGSMPSGKTMIQSAGLAEGVYFLSFGNNDFKTTKKIVVSK